ncbi:MAG: chlorophyll synthesis pathway protein BchC [Pseudomonadota bacterium]
METSAVILKGPRDLTIGSLALAEPKPSDIIVQISHSGISTGTEKLFYSGEMPPFPGMGYPLVPGYESVGEVVEAPKATGFRPGERVFVPGANCYGDGVKALFGGAARNLVTDASRAIRVDRKLGPEGALLALAATARHAMAGLNKAVPDLVVGHGVLGRLLARLTIAAGYPAPTVWEIDPNRREGAQGYQVVDPEDDPRNDYHSIYDASGQSDLLNALVGRITRGGEIVLAGFYTQPLSFAFPPAFMKEARFRISAEWTPDDLAATRALIDSGALSFSGLITHRRPASEAPAAYATAFDSTDCLKMILDWSGE